MRETLLSVGIDIGTSTTQLVLSRLSLENRANPFSVPRIAIVAREIRYRSDIHFTPLLSDAVIDASAVRDIVAAEYQKAGVGRGEIQTGAVIITGETARKENARELLRALAGFAGDFVVATAGPDLESILAARGAGADEYSKANHAELLHLDIGGGTSNLALYRAGELQWTGCLDIGGRLVKLSPQGVVSYVSPVLSGVAGSAVPAVGTQATPASLAPLVEALVDGLERAIPAGVTELSFSGGVADCMFAPPENWLVYGDLGVLLGRAIVGRFAARGYRLRPGAETIRATVVGAGAHAMELSGSTIFYRNVPFPLQNLPVLKLTAAEEALGGAALAAAIGSKLGWYADEGGMVQLALALTGEPSPHYGRVAELAAGIRAGLAPLFERGFFPVIAVEADMGQALGQALWGSRVGSGEALLCFDGVAAENGDYIDVGVPVAEGRVVPVVVKTLAFRAPP